MCKGSEVEGTWQLRGSREINPQQTWHCTDHRNLAPMEQMVHCESQWKVGLAGEA